MRVVITGASGLLGQEISDVFKKKHEIYNLKGKKDIDIINTKEIAYYIKDKKPDLIIHSAGWRDVDECEKNREKALLINSFGTRNVVNAAKMVKCPFVYISTSSVFEGNRDEPYTEFDETNPVNVYGYSKLKAEEQIVSLYDKYFILRVPILFSLKGMRSQNIIYQIIDSADRCEKTNATTNQITSPTYAGDVAESLIKMVETSYYGIYHMSNEGVASRYELLKEIADIKGLNSDNIIPCTAESIKFARRERYVALNNKVLEKTFDIKLSHWKDALKRCMKEIEKSPV